MSLVKFIDHDAAHFGQFGVLHELAQHHAFRHIDEPRFPRRDIIKTDLITHLRTQARIAFSSYALRQHARSDAPRLKDDAALTFFKNA